jgi:protein-disulfide isomerase
MARRPPPGRRAPTLRGGGPSPWVIAAVVVVVLFAGAVGFGVYRAQQAAAVVVPPGATETGVPIGQANAPATVDIYLDFQCPVCRAYEQATGDTIDQLVASGAARVVYHPVAYLDRFSSTRYSSRSSAASGCAAAAGVFVPFAKLLYANQPPENGDGLTDQKLVELGAQAGAKGDFAACVADGRYARWSAAVTDAASRAGVTGTPTVLVNGVHVDNTPEALRAAVANAR